MALCACLFSCPNRFLFKFIGDQIFNWTPKKIIGKITREKKRKSILGLTGASSGGDIFRGKILKISPCANHVSYSL